MHTTYIQLILASKGNKNINYTALSSLHKMIILNFSYMGSECQNPKTTMQLVYLPQLYMIV